MTRNELIKRNYDLICVGYCEPTRYQDTKLLEKERAKKRGYKIAKVILTKSDKKGLRAYAVYGLKKLKPIFANKRTEMLTYLDRLYYTTYNSNIPRKLAYKRLRAFIKRGA